MYINSVRLVPGKLSHLTRNYSTMSNEKNPVEFDKGDATSTMDAATVELGISRPQNAMERFCNRLDTICGVEARGIERIPEELRERDMAFSDYLHMFTMYANPHNQEKCT